jgi:two-component system sensor histidine kinase KdpD
MRVDTRRALAWLFSLAGLAAVTIGGRAMQLNANTVGFVFLIIVLFASVRGGLLVGTVSSIVATLCYNYFFFPPLGTFAIHDPANWVALCAFLITSVIVNRLVVAARLQAARAQSEALRTSLLRAISHDLTTPLTAITIQTEALKRRAAADGELRDVVNGIDDETRRLRRRIDNLLTMARLEAGKAQPRREPTPPADLFHAVREHVRAPLTVHVDDDCPDANVDPSLVLEILVNLIENAHRVSPPDAPIELTASRHGRQVRIEVLDRGPGLPPVDGTSDVAQRGLGLEIARGLAAANGGAFEITPRPGGGTIARVDLPAAPLPEETT